MMFCSCDDLYVFACPLRVRILMLNALQTAALEIARMCSYGPPVSQQKAHTDRPSSYFMSAGSPDSAAGAPHTALCRCCAVALHT